MHEWLKYFINCVLILFLIFFIIFSLIFLAANEEWKITNLFYITFAALFFSVFLSLIRVILNKGLFRETLKEGIIKEDNIKKFLSKIKKYQIDILILVGSWIILYFLIKPDCSAPHGLPSMRLDCLQPNHNAEWKMLGFILLTIGLDILIRKFLSSKNRQ